MVLYGKDVSVQDIVSHSKRYPMMAEKQVVIVKEAQHLARTIDQLSAYAENPQPTTVLVLCYKYSKFDKRKKTYKIIKKTGVCFESKKLYENQVADWIRKNLQGKGYKITPKASALLVEFLGTNLSKINNELEKLQLILPKEKEITPIDIEENIGISKDYNNFELKKAIGEVTLLNTFFTQLLKYHGMTSHNPKMVASTLGISPYFVNEYQVAAKNYPMKKVSAIVSNLRELDLKGKGVGATNISQADLLKELLVKII